MERMAVQSPAWSCLWPEPDSSGALCREREHPHQSTIASPVAAMGTAAPACSNGPLCQALDDPQSGRVESRQNNQSLSFCKTHPPLHMAKYRLSLWHHAESPLNTLLERRIIMPEHRKTSAILEEGVRGHDYRSEPNLTFPEYTQRPSTAPSSPPLQLDSDPTNSPPLSLKQVTAGQRRPASSPAAAQPHIHPWQESKSSHPTRSPTAALHVGSTPALPAHQMCHIWEPEMVRQQAAPAQSSDATQRSGQASLTQGTGTHPWWPTLQCLLSRWASLSLAPEAQHPSLWRFQTPDGGRLVSQPANPVFTPCRLHAGLCPQDSSTSCTQITVQQQPEQGHLRAPIAPSSPSPTPVMPGSSYLIRNSPTFNAH
ncbi:palmitoyltransferase ZDHHC8B isoform X1 [Lates japonicus]|uniref:Palmitoyltransferase ZDHHC8B isoform X1 n=1 Tax=Lates japonicus TaxID=270547 RepID=A0AAD3NE38_LATJO|nr:palmitoyltransferase ZDHHC8B isoform X1 [Lates japonicus]